MLKDATKGANFFENPVFEGLNEFKSSNPVDNEMDVIKSGLLMGKVLEDLDLYNNYYILNRFNRKTAVFYENLPFRLDMKEVFQIADPKEKKEMLLLELHQDYVLAEINDQLVKIETNKEVKSRYARFTLTYDVQPELGPLAFPILIEFKSPAELAGTFSANLEVETKDKQSSVLYITLLEKVPQRGALVLDQLVIEYNEQLSEDKKEVAQKSLEFLDSQIMQTLAELSLMEQGIESFKNTRNVVNVQTDTQVYQENYIRNNKEISDLENQIEIYTTVLEVVSNDSEGDISGLSSLIRSDSYLTNTMTEYQDAKAKITEYEKSIMPDNPLMIKQKSILNAARTNIISHIGINKKQLEITVQNLRNENAQFANKSNAAPRLERQYEEISRDLGIKKEHYLYLIKKKEETALFIASVPSNQAKVIENASFGYIPVKPYPPVLYMAGLFLSFTIPFAWVFGGSLLSDKINARSDLSGVSDIEVLGEISYVKNNDIFAINYKNNSAISEQFRLIRSNFNYKSNADDCKAIMITSSISGEGKTFFALNFAKSLSMVGKRVAVLEYDLRKKGLKNDLKIQSEKGISNYLTSEDFTLKELMESGNEINGITFFQVGNIAEDPAEIMHSNKNAAFIAMLKNQYDYVVIDTAPIGLVSDALALTDLVDYSIFIVRYDYTSKKNLDFFLDIINSNRLKNPMIVINGSKKSEAYTYGNYSYH
ncbi:GumC family protein [Algoriphagus sp.]|uniref:GumC family protein n=1 Tax=Algoriphagus sp. TaxID=1872435 RepID=UPI003F7230FD